MIRVLIIAGEGETQTELRKGLSQHDLKCYFIPPGDAVPHAVNVRQPDILLFEMGTEASGPDTPDTMKRISKEKDLPVIALIPEKLLDSIDGQLEFDDFITSPYYATEIALRINRLVGRTNDRETSESIVYNDLVIDLATCEVAVEGKIIELTFKEYEMLKLLAGHPGRVYTRQVLLDRIWGYDYFGGDRTVDVHIRRLRSKIEDANHTFIETVRNIGYRFVKKS
jgi:DNA-binding response OmpR family regulator